MRSLQESRPNYQVETFNYDDIKQKFDEISAANFSAEDRLLYDLLISQNPVHAVGVLAVDSINKINRAQDDTHAQIDVTLTDDFDQWEGEYDSKDAEQSPANDNLKFAEWESDLQSEHINTPNNKELSSLGYILDAAKGYITDEESVEQWLVLKQSIAKTKQIPESDVKSIEIAQLSSAIVRFCNNYDISEQDLQSVT